MHPSRPFCRRYNVDSFWVDSRCLDTRGEPGNRRQFSYANAFCNANSGCGNREKYARSAKVQIPQFSESHVVHCDKVSNRGSNPNGCNSTSKLWKSASEIFTILD